MTSDNLLSLGLSPLGSTTQIRLFIVNIFCGGPWTAFFKVCVGNANFSMKVCVTNANFSMKVCVTNANFSMKVCVTNANFKYNVVFLHIDES